jgi:chemotaxis protein methyltransferase CheR
MRRARLGEPDAYLAGLDSQAALLDDLVAEITVGETYLFRDPRQFAVVRDRIVPALASRRAPGHALRIWSAGCATGEEAYTLAILAREAGWAEAAHIVGTDLSRAALAAARRGLYGRWSLRGVPEHVVRTYFRPMGDRFQLAPVVRNAVEFRYLNLAEDAYPSLPTGIWAQDLILCRNVLIYFDPETVARVARRLMDSLSDDGWLLLGASDPPLTDLLPCDVVLTEAGLAYRRSGRSAARPTATVADGGGLPLPLALPMPPQSPAPAERQGGAAEDPVSAARWYAERDYARAADLARRLVLRDGSDPAPWVLLVRALANRGELEAAGEACAAALDRHRSCAELAYLHAVLLAEAGRHDAAAAAARRALYLDRELVVAHLALGGALARGGDRRGAHRAVQNAERLLARMPPEQIVAASDGEPAGRLAEMTRVQLRLLQPGTAA